MSLGHDLGLSCLNRNLGHSSRRARERVVRRADGLQFGFTPGDQLHRLPRRVRAGRRAGARGTFTMRRIAVLNQKGGVGKTTSTVNLGAALAAEGYRTLVLDLDPQAHATLHLGLLPGRSG